MTSPATAASDTLPPGPSLGLRNSWSSSGLPASAVRAYSSRASWAERTRTVLRSPEPGRQQPGRLHFATTGSPRRQAADAARSALSGATVTGCGTFRAAHTAASSALSATCSGSTWEGPGSR
ncbi:hypothetical protein SGLAM104S_06545 [Streptomyces glaucescens]